MKLNLIVNQSNEPKLESYLNDVQSFINWLSSKLIKRQDCEQNRAETSMPTLPVDPFNLKEKHDNRLNNIICYLSTFIVSVVHNECDKVFKRTKRENPPVDYGQF